MTRHGDTRLNNAVKFGAVIKRAPSDGVFSSGPVTRVIDGTGAVIHGPLRGYWQVARARLWGLVRLHVWLRPKGDTMIVQGFLPPATLDALAKDRDGVVVTIDTTDTKPTLTFTPNSYGERPIEIVLTIVEK